MIEEKFYFILYDHILVYVIYVAGKVAKFWRSTDIHLMGDCV